MQSGAWTKLRSRCASKTESPKIRDKSKADASGRLETALIPALPGPPFPGVSALRGVRGVRGVLGAEKSFPIEGEGATACPGDRWLPCPGVNGCRNCPGVCGLNEPCGVCGPTLGGPPMPGVDGLGYPGVVGFPGVCGAPCPGVDGCPPCPGVRGPV